MLIWQQKTAVYLGIAIASFWFLFGMIEALVLTHNLIFGLIEGGLVGGIFAISTLIAARKPLWGGIILLLEGLYPLLMIFFHKSNMIYGLSVLGIPPLCAGLLFLWTYIILRRVS